MSISPNFTFLDQIFRVTLSHEEKVFTSVLLASFFVDFPTMLSVRTPQDASNEPAVEPSLADPKPAEATEVLEVPWTWGHGVVTGKLAT